MPAKIKSRNTTYRQGGIIMKTKTRIISLLMVLLLSVGLITGCGQKEENETSDKTSYQTVKILNNKESLCLAPVHIAIINGYFDEEFAAIGQEYKIVNSNIDTITEQITSGEINEKIIQIIAHPQIEIVEALRVIATQPIDSP